MQAYCTIPAAASAEAEEPLSREVKVNAKTILGGVAATAFVLGMMAATAVRSSSNAVRATMTIQISTLIGSWSRSPPTQQTVL